MFHRFLFLLLTSAAAVSEPEAAAVAVSAPESSQRRDSHVFCDDPGTLFRPFYAPSTLLISDVKKLTSFPVVSSLPRQEFALCRLLKQLVPADSSLKSLFCDPCAETGCSLECKRRSASSCSVQLPPMTPCVRVGASKRSKISFEAPSLDLARGFILLAGTLLVLGAVEGRVGCCLGAFKSFLGVPAVVLLWTVALVMKRDIPVGKILFIKWKNVAQNFLYGTMAGTMLFVLLAQVAVLADLGKVTFASELVEAAVARSSVVGDELIDFARFAIEPLFVLPQSSYESGLLLLRLVFFSALNSVVWDLGQPWRLFLFMRHDLVQEDFDTRGVKFTIGEDGRRLDDIEDLEEELLSSLSAILRGVAGTGGLALVSQSTWSAQVNVYLVLVVATSAVLLFKRREIESGMDEEFLTSSPEVKLFIVITTFRIKNRA